MIFFLFRFIFAALFLNNKIFSLDKITLFILIFSSFIFTVHASENLVLDETVVTATRIDRPAKEIGSPISVIDSALIDTRQFDSLSEAISTSPGLHGVSIGGKGHQTSYFVRGSNSNHSMVLIDGIEMSDPSASSGAFDFGNIFLGIIDKIEILRGAQASMYGSEAIGGVVNIISALPEKNSLSTSLSMGSDNMLQEKIKYSKVRGNWKTAWSVIHSKSNLETLTESRFAPVGSFNESDGYENLSSSFRYQLKNNDNLELDYVIHYFDTKAELDPTAEDPDSNSTSTQYFSKINFAFNNFNHAISNNIGISISHISREFFNYPDTLQNTFQSTQDVGERVKLDTRTDIFKLQNNTLSLGFEYEHESFKNTQFADFSGFVIQGSTRETAITKTIYIQDTYNPTNDLTVVGDLRYDKNSRFKGTATYRISPVLLIKSLNGRIRGAYGTGHRAPALFELFGQSTTAFGDSFRGNRNLRPEESTSWELGFDKFFFNKKIFTGLTYFNSKIDNLIVASGFPTIPIVALDAKIDGVESVLSFTLNKKIKINNSYTFVSAENSNTGGSLLRRPKHKYNFEIISSPNENFSISGSLSYVGEMFDVGFNGGNIYKGGYTIGNIRSEWKFNNDIRFYGKVNNIFDKDYAVADGFRGFGRRLFIGIEKKW